MLKQDEISQVQQISLLISYFSENMARFGSTVDESSVFFFSFFLLQIPCSFILLPAIYMSIIVVAPPVQVFGSFPCLQDSIIIKAAGKERFLYS